MGKAKLYLLLLINTSRTYQIPQKFLLLDLNKYVYSRFAKSEFKFFKNTFSIVCFPHLC